MSKEVKYIENCLEKLANGDCSFDLNTDILKKNNDAGKLARLVKLLVDKERKKSDELKKLAGGHFDIGTYKTIGKVDSTSESIEIIAETMSNILMKLKTVSEDLNNGNKDIRFDDSKYNGGFKKIVATLNDFLDTVLAPIGEVQNVIEAMSVNDFTVHITGDYSGVCGGLTKDINALCDNFNMIESCFQKLADGDFSNADLYRKIGKRSENDKLTPSIVKMTDAMEALTNEASYITEGCLAGNVFATRGNSEKFNGGYKSVIEGMNRVLDTTAASLTECISVVSALSVNNLSVNFLGSFKGDFSKMSTAIDGVRERLLLTQNIAQNIAQGDTTEFDKIKEMGKLSDEDELTPALIGMMENVRNLVNDTSAMATAAEGGNLLYRIDTSNVKGEFVSMLECFNRAFDTMSSPIIEMSAVLEGLSTGDTNTMVTGAFTGVFDALKNDVNAIIQQNQNLVDVITKTLTMLANGNLDIEKVKELDGDWNGVPIALNNIIDSLNILVGNIYSTVDEVAAGANQVAVGSQELSQGATEQASSIEELTASIAEIASQTKLNAQNAGKASSLAKSMRDSAASGNKEMKEMLTSMQEINDSSRNISKIIKVIDDIAFQTNILALNAAVEAARAGQHGKGFAVVADEVRNLAAKSANAANDTTALIEGSINRVEKGTKIAENTAKTLSNIVTGVDKVAELVEDIAVASNEQATGITQVNQGLEQVSKVVQTNSATAEQSAAASEELSGQAGLLKSNVEKFKLRDDGVTHSSRIKKATDKVTAEAAAAENRNAPSYQHNNIDLNDNFGKY